MSGRRTAAIVCTVVLATAAALIAGDRQTPQAPGPATFRSVTDVVSVPVTVRLGSDIVGGLRTDDFLLIDNDAEQRVEIIEAEALPVDLTLVLDTSGSTDLVVERLTRDVRAIAALLRPIDRVRLLTIDTYATEVFPMQPAAAPVSLERLTRSGLSSVHDTIAVALLRPVPLDRRHLIVVMTDGIDSISAISATALVDVAARSDAVLHVLRVDTEPGLETKWIFACENKGECSRQARYWLAFQDRELGTIADAARATGGDLREQGMFRNRDAPSMIRTLLDELRQSYLLRYTPRGVTRRGWHRIEVRVRGAKPYVVRARRGYAIDTPERAASAPPARKPGTPVTTLPELVADYERAESADLTAGLPGVTDLASFVREFRARGNPWPATPRREALFVIEVAAAALFAGDLESRGEALRMLEWYQRLVRHPLEPDDFERLWLWAQISLVEGMVSPAQAMPAVNNAIARFPDEGRFHLARAVVLDQRWPRGTHESPVDGMGLPIPPSAVIAETMAAYERAAESAATRIEARVRQAYLLLRVGRPGEALEKLDLPDTADKGLQYLHRLLRGKALAATGQPDAADASYRAALEVWPAAQSARVAIMTLAMTRGDRTVAEAMAETIETQPRNSSDPFWHYWQGDARFYPAIVAALRQQVLK